MPRVKTKRFAANDTDSRVVQPGKIFFDHAKGNWAKEFFGNHYPVVLELACGRGEYTV
jgi:tRNA (guanine-N7-)-methyltransferase